MVSENVTFNQSISYFFDNCLNDFWSFQSIMFCFVDRYLSVQITRIISAVSVDHFLLLLNDRSSKLSGSVWQFNDILLATSRQNVRVLFFLLLKKDFKT
jgi:hypothetical protein